MSGSPVALRLALVQQGAGITTSAVGEVPLLEVMGEIEFEYFHIPVCQAVNFLRAGCAAVQLYSNKLEARCLSEQLFSLREAFDFFATGTTDTFHVERVKTMPVHGFVEERVRAVYIIKRQTKG